MRSETRPVECVKLSIRTPTTISRLLTAVLLVCAVASVADEAEGGGGSILPPKSRSASMGDRVTQMAPQSLPPPSGG